MSELESEDGQLQKPRSRWQQYVARDLTFADMDDEELARGQFKDREGGWQGGGVQMLSPLKRQELKRELLKRGQDGLDGMYLACIETLSVISSSSAAKDSDRLKAITMIMERVAGKVPERVEVGGADAFADVLAGIVDDSVTERRGAGLPPESPRALASE